MPTPSIDIQKLKDTARHARYSASSLAKLNGFSLRQVQRLFQRATGKTPGTWLREFRQNEALILLTKGNTPKEAACELGYRQLSHFCRDFKRFHGIAPGLLSNLDKRIRYVVFG